MSGSEPSQQIYLYNYAFNQDCTCFSIATTVDFRTFTLTPALAEVSRRQVPDSAGTCGPIKVASMLFRTNLLALVTQQNPYRAILWDDSTGLPAHELWSRFEVLNVVLRRDVVCVVSEYKIYVYEFGNQFQVLLHLETFSNPKGVCAVSPGSATEWTLVCPGQHKGQVRIQRGLDDAVSSTLNAHSNPVAAVSVSSDGALAASASELGTVVKVYNSTDGQLLYEFRRGSSAVQISSLTFRLDKRFLLVGSASQTVHVFKLDGDSGSGSAINQMLGKVAEWRGGSPIQTPAVMGGDVIEGPPGTGGGNKMASLMPKYFHSSRAFATFRIPDTGHDLRISPGTSTGSPVDGPICCFSKDSPNKIFIVHMNGLVYEATFDGSADFGQECAFSGAAAYFQARPEFEIKSGKMTQELIPTSTGEDSGDVWNVI